MKTNQLVRVFLLGGFIFMAAQLSASDGYSIEGRVINTKSESIKGAVVTLLDPNTLASVANGECNKNGEFYIDSVMEGEYILTVKKDGYFRARTKKIIVDENGNYVVKNNQPNNSDEPENSFIANR